MEFLENVFLDNSIRRWLTALLLGLASFGVVRVLLTLVRGRFTRLAARTATPWDDYAASALSRTHSLLVLGIALSASIRTLVLPDRADRALATLAALLLIVQGAIWVGAILTAWLDATRQRKMSEDPATATTLTALGFVGKVVIWSVALLLGLDNLGVDVTALVAGLGVGGIAVALAVQSILGDLFASLSIVLDKPFVLGDFLIVGEHLGAVEHIGLRTTRIRSLSGEQLVFSNTDLLGARIRNFGRMTERRVAFSVGVTYGTPPEKLRRIPDVIREAIESRERTRFDRSHFKQFGNFSLDFESVYYVLAPDYNLFMDIQQAIQLEIYERFAAEGIEFAYPTQTIHVAGRNGRAGEDAPAAKEGTPPVEASPPVGSSGPRDQ
jgi:small-conductance mechanosensitive channel